MSRTTIRVLVVLATLCIVGIIVTQVYWFRRAFNVEEDQFNRDVNTALYNVANQFFNLSNTTSPIGNPIKQLSTNYYVVMIDNDIDANLLESLLTSEFEKRSIKAHYEYGIYDCTSERMVYGNYVEMGGANPVTNPKSNLPKWAGQSYYFGVHFPNKQSIIAGRMNIWIFSSVVLLIVILFFAYALFVILKQKRLSEIQKDFINNMTHEFKTPISTIALSTDVLKDPSIISQPERLANYASIIENENKRLKGQVERVLQMASMSSNKLSQKTEKLDLHQLIEEVVASFKIIIEEKAAHVKVKLDANKYHIEGDHFHITNALYNLLDNALKYTPNNPNITVKSYNESNKIKIEFIDNGRGIDKSHQRQIFKRFYRIPTGNVHDVKGFGLGLNYVQQVVKSHGGSIVVESEKGKGSTFKLTLKNV